MKAPLKIFEDLPNHYAQTNIAFSPDEQLFLTGTSVERESTTGGLLCFFDRAKLELVLRVGISPTCSVVQCAWHPKLNQVSSQLVQGDLFIRNPFLQMGHGLLMYFKAQMHKCVSIYVYRYFAALVCEIMY